MNNKRNEKRMTRLFQIIDREVFLSDNREDLLLLASVLMTCSVRIYRNLLGEIGLKSMLGMIEKNNPKKD